MNVSQASVLGKSLDSFTYLSAPGLWVVTPYYNPMGYQTRRRNYEMFASVLRASGIPLLTIECAFGDQPYDLPESLDVIKVRGQSVLWQKERLLNLAISWLPSSCDTVAWLDCDLIFPDPAWARKTVAALETSPIVQVFKSCHTLPENFAETKSCGKMFDSFAHVVCNNPSVLKTGEYKDHGHPGYGWAARKDILQRHGLYEYAIAGSADHYMAHAAVGDLDSPCIARMMFDQPALMEPFRDWAESFHESVQGKLGIVPNEVMHLWHGEAEHRKYFLRQLELSELGFDPRADIIATPGKPLELRPGNEALEEFLMAYFANRREDGVQIKTAA